MTRGFYRKQCQLLTRTALAESAGCREEAPSASDLHVTAPTWATHPEHPGLTDAVLTSSHMPEGNRNLTAKDVENVDSTEAFPGGGDEDSIQHQRVFRNLVLTPLPPTLSAPTICPTVSPVTGFLSAPTLTKLAAFIAGFVKQNGKSSRCPSPVSTPQLTASPGCLISSNNIPIVFLLHRLQTYFTSYLNRSWYPPS